MRGCSRGLNESSSHKHMIDGDLRPDGLARRLPSAVRHWAARRRASHLGCSPPLPVEWPVSLELRGLCSRVGRDPRRIPRPWPVPVLAHAHAPVQWGWTVGSVPVGPCRHRTADATKRGIGGPERRCNRPNYGQTTLSSAGGGAHKGLGGTPLTPLPPGACAESALLQPMDRHRTCSGQAPLSEARTRSALRYRCGTAKHTHAP